MELVLGKGGWRRFRYHEYTQLNRISRALNDRYYPELGFLFGFMYLMYLWIDSMPQMFHRP